MDTIIKVGRKSFLAEFEFGDVVFHAARLDYIKGIIIAINLESGGGISYSVNWNGEGVGSHSANELLTAYQEDATAVELFRGLD